MIGENVKRDIYWPLFSYPIEKFKWVFQIYLEALLVVIVRMLEQYLSESITFNGKGSRRNLKTSKAERVLLQRNSWLHSTTIVDQPRSWRLMGDSVRLAAEASQTPQTESEELTQDILFSHTSNWKSLVPAAWLRGWILPPHFPHFFSPWALQARGCLTHWPSGLYCNTDYNYSGLHWGMLLILKISPWFLSKVCIFFQQKYFIPFLEQGKANHYYYLVREW